MDSHSPNQNGMVSEVERASPLSNSSSTTRIAMSLLSSSSNPDPLSIGQECWVVGERVTQEEVLRVLRPTVVAEQRRRLVAEYVRGLVRDCVGGEVFAYGSVPLRTYLPDGDIDLTSVSGRKADDTLAMEVHTVLEKEAQNNAIEFTLKDVHYINAEVKLVKCVVQNIVVDISFNQIGGLCTLGFLERVNQFIGKDHIFKCSIILVKAWCYYESRILGAYHGLISTYALEMMVLCIFNYFHSSLNGPLSVLYRFLDYYSKFDWEKYCVSIKGPVSVSFLPEIIAETPENDGEPLLLPNEFMQSCISLYITPVRSKEINQKPFTRKYLNIIDPLRDNNNLGRSVNKGNFYRIRAALSYGARQLGRILSSREENIGDELKKFFSGTLGRHKNEYRADLQGNLPPKCGCTELVPSFLKPEFGEYRPEQVASSSLTNSKASVEDVRIVPQQLSHEEASNVGSLEPERTTDIRIQDEPQRHADYLQSSRDISVGIEPQSHSAYFQSSTGISIENEPQRHSAHFLSSSSSIGNEKQIHYAHLQCSQSMNMESELQRHSAHLQSVLGISVREEPQRRHSIDLQSSDGISVGNEPQRNSAHHQSSTGTRIGNEMQRYIPRFQSPPVMRHPANLHQSPGMSVGNEPHRHTANLQPSSAIRIVNEPQRHIINFQPPPTRRIGNGPQTHSAHHQSSNGAARIWNELQRHTAHLQPSPGMRNVDKRQGYSTPHPSSTDMRIGNEPQNMEIPQFPSPLDDRLIFGTVGGPDHALDYYNSSGFSETVKFENVTQDQIVLANASTPDGDFSSQFSQLPNGMYSHVLPQEAKNLEFVHNSEIVPSNPLRHLPVVDSTCGFLSFHPVQNPMDELAFSLGQMSVENIVPENHQTMNPQLDLSGDPHAHFQHMHFALWCRDHSSSAPNEQAPPLLLFQPPLLSQLQNKSSSETLHQPNPASSSAPNMTSFPNNIHQAPPFYPRNHPEHPPISIGGEERPKARGLGTYFPNLDHQFQKEKEYGRVRNNWAPPTVDQSRRQTPVRERMPNDRNLHRNAKQENLEADTPVSHGKEEAENEEPTETKNEEQPTDDGSPTTIEEISPDNDNLPPLDNDNLPPPLDNDNLPPPENVLDSPTREEISFDDDNFPPLGSTSLHNGNDPSLEKVMNVLDSPTREEISFDDDNFPPLGSTSLHNGNDPSLEKVIWPSREATSLHNDNEHGKLKTGSANDEKAVEPSDPLHMQKDDQRSDENSVSVPELTYHLKDEKDFPPLTR